MKKYLALLALGSLSLASAQPVFPLYAGVSLGYGSTDWSELVNHDSNPNDASQVLNAAPESAEDRGRVLGVFVGYTFNPNYALELTYRKFKTSNIHFDTDYSLYYVNNVQLANLDSNTYNISLLNKFIWNVTDKFGLFSDIGPGYTRRTDIFAGVSDGVSDGNMHSMGQLVATFGAGANYAIAPHVMATIEGDYSTGWGKSELYPVDDYVPFLYSVDFKLAYRF